MVVIVDYGIGNIGSIANMFRKIGIECQVVNDVKAMATAERLILPGVGSFDAGMTLLAKAGIAEVLSRRVLEDHVPVLGICLGMQLMMERSEEGTMPGLGWVRGRVARLQPQGLPVPHMGWNVARAVKENPLLDTAPEEPQRFYFVHSYYVECAESEDVLAQTDYGGEFCSAFQHANIFGVQFHPEKSHAFGMALLKKFGEL